MITITETGSVEDIEIIRTLFREYQQAIGVDLCFQGFNEELTTLPGRYSPPSGGLFLAFDDGDPIGCVALRPLEPKNIAELKRLYVRPPGRGRHIGRMLTERAIHFARNSGYKFIRLDTLPSMQNAQNLYRDLGFREISAYTFNPMEGVTYMELDLKL